MWPINSKREEYENKCAALEIKLRIYEERNKELYHENLELKRKLDTKVQTKHQVIGELVMKLYSEMYGE